MLYLCRKYLRRHELSSPIKMFSARAVDVGSAVALGKKISVLLFRHRSCAAGANIMVFPAVLASTPPDDASVSPSDDVIICDVDNYRCQQQQQQQQREAPPFSTTSQDDDDDTSSPKYLELTTQRYEKEEEEEEVQDNTPNHLPATNRRNIGVFFKSHGDEEDSEIRSIDIKEDNNKEEIEDDDDDDTSNKSSVFSLDSFHRINVQWATTTTTTKHSSSIHHHHHHRAGVLLTHDAPFASVVVKGGGGIQNFDNDDITTNNVCPCQCIYFTMRETICLIISAMGCSVFLAGIISLCFYLSGWWNVF